MTRVTQVGRTDELAGGVGPRRARASCDSGDTQPDTQREESRCCDEESLDDGWLGMGASQPFEHELW